MDSSFTHHNSIEQYMALLEVSEAIAAHRDLPGLFHDLAQRLPKVLAFDFIGLVLHDAERNTSRLHILETPLPTTIPSCTEHPSEDTPGGWVWKTQEPLIVPDITAETRFANVIQMMRENGVRSFCMVPLT